MVLDQQNNFRIIKYCAYFSAYLSSDGGGQMFFHLKFLCKAFPLHKHVNTVCLSPVVGAALLCINHVVCESVYNVLSVSNSLPVNSDLMWDMEHGQAPVFVCNMMDLPSLANITDLFLTLLNLLIYS